MMAMNIRSSVVMATNSGFSGKSVNETLSSAVRTLSTNPAIANSEEAILSSAIDNMKPTPPKAGQETNTSLPMNNSRGSGMSV